MNQAPAAPQSAFLETLRIKNAGPIHDFTLHFQDPVTVIAGPNGSGKTTILLAASSAYNPTHINQAGHFDPLLPRRQDPAKEDQPALEFTYSLNGQTNARKVTLQESMTGTGPEERPIFPTYVKTLGHLSSVPEPVYHDPEQAASIANRVLGRDYQQITLQPGARNYELAVLQADGAWRKRHQLSLGEITVAQLSYDLSRSCNGLALLDQLETGLHLNAQRSLMKELDLLSTKNNIQFIITTHSPEIFWIVPESSRILLNPATNGDLRSVQRQD